MFEQRRSRLITAMLLVFAIAIIGLVAGPPNADQPSAEKKIGKMDAKTSVAAIVEEKSIGNYAEIVHSSVERRFEPAALRLPVAPVKKIDHVPI
jgi:hypothetical protein